ncbi:B3/B4 domain-containing protein (DNA/RNA-binding domain of Phe-tRNA-synthetase) [Planifilum fulgidum]|jgi:DNA/RNA-binding domain of Phe-tRNA-synthetase-like protein|uniref:B3/B4 domain-containing protein (DNA/RNA-binding domain of Phe-tRNA-synthetase) n=2 Tax=Planifilum fulgidum TaxID=201973 RepID=A0A1I2SGK8_9BACL|nr:B3/B4 domain-containing protein (DNA/RNA-binding domain of Phe-tRNA-synthetase) [Planifilum fulgidum]
MVSRPEVKKQTMVNLDSELRSQLPNLQLIVIRYEGCTVSRSPHPFRGRFELFLEHLRIEHSMEKIGGLQPIREWREAFRRLGSSPSRYRPSAEALLRRVLKGDTLPEVNSAVDVNNFFSLKYLLPFGIYDADALKGTITATVGKAGDGYPALNGREVSMENKLLLRDESGPFGSPYVDSARAAVTEKSSRLLQVIFHLNTIEGEDPERIAGTVASSFTQINGGTAESAVIS